MAIDLVGGTIGGVALAVVGHPLDLVKSRLQMAHSPYHGVIDCVRKTAAHEGLRGFFKGLSPPLLMTGYTNAVLFTANGVAQRLVRGTQTEPLSALQLLLATWLAAPVYVFALTPIEVVKVRLQTQSASAGKGVYAGPIDCVRRMVRDEGMAALFKGFSATLASRFVGLPFYIAGYSLFKRALTAWNGGVENFAVSLVAGGLAGMSFWTANYPLDCLKTRLQTHAGAQRLGLVATARAVLAEEGVRGLYKGFSACLLRAFPANAAQFSVNDWSTRLMRSRFLNEER